MFKGLKLKIDNESFFFCFKEYIHLYIKLRLKEKMCKRDLLKLALEYSNKRANITNAHNGKAYMSCLILGKSNQYVLCKRNKLLQC
jgi:hypothetical protein